MTNPFSSEDDLVQDIWFALRQSSLVTKPKPRNAESDPRRVLARQIVAKLKQSNWRFERGPPRQSHTTHQNKKPDV